MEEIDNDENDLELLGVSVQWLSEIFLKQVVEEESSTIHDLESFGIEPGLIRQKGLNETCPVDGKLGSSYVHCLRGTEYVGRARYMLSYSWSYTIGDIVHTLEAFCKTQKLNPSETFVWICFLCVNQHRVMEQKDKGGTGLLNFEEEFPKQLKRIGHMLAMMTPWNDPWYLKRIWCVFEIYTAYECDAVDVTIVMPPKQQKALEEDLLGEKGSSEALFVAFSKTRIQDAQATFERDKTKILGMINEQVGYGTLNNKVNEHLFSWVFQMVHDIAEEWMTTTDGERNDLFSAHMHFNVAEFMYTFRPTKRTALFTFSPLNEAFRWHHSSLQIREKLLGTNHLDTAESYAAIGAVSHSRGDYKQALDYHRKALSIRKSILGENDRRVAKSQYRIGLALYSLGDYEESLDQHRKALETQLSVLGEQHVDTAWSYNCIGRLLKVKGEYDAALIQYQHDVTIKEVIKGEWHPDTAMSYNNIGMLLYSMGRYGEALVEHRKALKIRESMFGGDHPLTVICHKNIRQINDAAREEAARKR